MGVSLLMTPGPIGRNFGEQVNITPGCRSAGAEQLRTAFGDFPMTLTSNDRGTLEIMASGAAVYTDSANNMWKLIAAAIAEHGAVTIVAEY